MRTAFSRSTSPTAVRMIMADRAGRQWQRGTQPGGFVGHRNSSSQAVPDLTLNNWEPKPRHLGRSAPGRPPSSAQHNTTRVPSLSYSPSQVAATAPRTSPHH